MSTIDTSKVYVLKNSYNGSDKILSSSPNGLIMVDAANPRPAALWIITPTNVTPYYRLHSIASGLENSLTVKDSDSSRVVLGPTQTAEAQYWRFDAWSGSDNYPHRLSNLSTGLDKHLDVTSVSHIGNLQTDDHTGQHWALVPASTTSAF